jgi:glycosyltransferase involved in cell wall biosynthesis
MPNVVLEAMAVGCPVVAANVEGLAELIRHGDSGWLVPANDPAALARVLADVLRDPATASKMGKVAQAVCRQSFTIESMVQQYAALYTNVLRQQC